MLYIYVGRGRAEVRTTHNMTNKGDTIFTLFLAFLITS